MIPSDERPKRAFQEYRDLITLTVDGKPPTVVAGQAVNIWGTYYLPRIHKDIAEFLPLVSKDLDLHAGVPFLYQLRESFGVSLPPLHPRSPVSAHLAVTINGVSRELDVMSSVNGLSLGDLDERFELEVGGFKASVLTAPIVLKAKLANAHNIPQAGRQDIRQIRIMIPCVREYLVDLVNQAEVLPELARPAVAQLNKVHSIINSPSARDVSLLHSLPLQNVWPMAALEAAQHPSLKNFVAHRFKGERPSAKELIAQARAERQRPPSPGPRQTI